MAGKNRKKDKNHDKNYNEKNYLEIISKKIDALSLSMEKSRISDYINYLENPRKLIFANFISGVARGFGIAVGFSLLGAIGLYLLRKIVMLNLPVIGDFIADIVNIVQDNLSRSGGKIGL